MRLRAVVEMNADKNGVFGAIGERGTIGQRHIGIARSGQACRHLASRKQLLDALSDIEGKVFFQNVPRHRSGIRSAVAGIKHDQRKRFGAFLRLSAWGDRRRLLKHERDERYGEQC